MGQIIVRNLDNAVIERLKARASAANTSLEQTVRDILTNAATRDRADLLAKLDAIRAKSPPSTLDSTALIREDRDNDEPYR